MAGLDNEAWESDGERDVVDASDYDLARALLLAPSEAVAREWQARYPHDGPSKHWARHAHDVAAQVLQ
jgi:hypothetical protein